MLEKSKKGFGNEIIVKNYILELAKAPWKVFLHSTRKETFVVLFLGTLCEGVNFVLIKSGIKQVEVLSFEYRYPDFQNCI